MAGFGGIPIGNIGAYSGANFDPYLRMRQMQMQQSQFDRELEDRRKARAGGEQFDMIQFEAAQRQAELDRAAKERQFAGQMEIERGGLGLRGQETGLRAKELEQRGTLAAQARGDALTAREDDKAQFEYGKSRDAKADAERESAKAEKERLAAEAQAREKAVKEAVVWAETYTANVDAGDMNKVGRVAQNAKLLAQRQFAGDPDAMMAAIDRVNAWEDEQFNRAGKERKAKLEETELENTQLAKKLTLEDREQARKDKTASDAEERQRKREEADARLLARAYENLMDQAMELEKQAMQAEALGDTTTAEALRVQADGLSTKADAMGQKLGFFE